MLCDLDFEFERRQIRRDIRIQLRFQKRAKEFAVMRELRVPVEHRAYQPVPSTAVFLSRALVPATALVDVDRVTLTEASGHSRPAMRPVNRNCKHRA